MDPARIAELLEPFLGPANEQPLTTSDLDHISTYIDILVRWNARINLSAIRDPEDIVPRHFGESIFAARHLFPPPSSVSSVVRALDPVYCVPPAYPDAGRMVSALDSVSPVSSVVNALDSLADIGSGAGFPGLPIKLWAPQLRLILIESNHKKATFLREVTRALTLTNVDIQTTRAETLPPASFGVVTLRAVERFETILPTAAALVAPAGRLALLISSAQFDTARTTLPTLTWANPIPVPLSRNRVLAIALRPQ